MTAAQRAGLSVVHDLAPAGANPAANPAAVHEPERSRFIQRLHRRYAREMSLLPAGTPDAAGFESAFAALKNDGHPTGAALRILRQVTLERLADLDCRQGAPAALVMRAMTGLAEFWKNTLRRPALVSIVNR